MPVPSYAASISFELGELIAAKQTDATAKDEGGGEPAKLVVRVLYNSAPLPLLPLVKLANSAVDSKGASYGRSASSARSHGELEGARTAGASEVGQAATGHDEAGPDCARRDARRRGRQSDELVTEHVLEPPTQELSPPESSPLEAGAGWVPWEAFRAYVERMATSEGQHRAACGEGAAEADAALQDTLLGQRRDRTPTPDGE